MGIHSPLGETNSLCPSCLEPVAGNYVREDDAVVLERECDEHGRTRRTIWASADHWEWATTFGPEPDPTANLTVDHQHACLAVVEVTERCNLSCSYCFASSGPSGDHRSFEEVVELLDVVLQHGGPRPIQFSGGEPTVRDDLPELVETAVDMGFSHIQVNTNGLEVAERSGYAERLTAAGVTAIYLQFDGVHPETYRQIRGRDLTGVKAAAIESCRRAGLPVVLVPTVVPDVNEDEMGDIVEFAIEHDDVVRGINFQPVAHFGRYADHHGRFSLDAAAGTLADQLETVEVDDFLPVPCCSGTCQLGTALLSGNDGTPVPVTTFIGEEFATSMLAEVDEADWLEFLVGTPTALGRATVLSGCCDLEATGLGGCCGPGTTGDDSCRDDRSGDGNPPRVEEPPGLVETLFDEVLTVTFTGFMDADAADVGRLANCCISVPTPNGDLAPFCGYNMTTEDGRYALRTRHGWGGRETITSGSQPSRGE